MSARIPPSYAEAWCKFTLAGDTEPMYVGLGLDLASGVTANQTTTNQIDTVMINVFKTLVTNSYEVGPGHVIYGNDGGDIRIDSTNNSSTGTASGNAVPQNTAVLVRKNTASGGRRARGRMFVPGMSEGDISPAGVISGLAVSSYQTAMNNLVSTLVALSDVDGLVLLHDTAPFTPTPITGLAVQATVATQRRRLRR